MKTLVGLVLLLWSGTAYAQMGQTPTSCQFVIRTDETPLYNAPIPHVSYQIDLLPGDISYPILKFGTKVQFIDMPVLIAVGEDIEGWVTLGNGSLEGDCDSVAINTMAFTDYPTVCTFTNDADEKTYAVIGFKDGEYTLWVDHAYSFEVTLDEGTLGGACTDRANATALENTRLWTQPDVLEGLIIMAIAPDTPLTVIAGPVRGVISLDREIVGDWYRVSDASGAIGWVWSGRLKFD